MTEHQQLQTQLHNRQAALQERLARIKADFAAGRSSDWPEQAQERENDDTLSAIEHEAVEELQQIDAALSRLQDGHYGLCQNCGNAIEAARLQAMPQATLCIACAQGVHDAR